MVDKSTILCYASGRNGGWHMDCMKICGIEAGKGRYFEEAFYTMILVYTILFDKVSKYLDAFDLTPAKMNVLMVIKHQGGVNGLSQRDIGRRLMVTSSNMTRLLDKLEREKLIERESREGDKRVKEVRVSNRGSQILDNVWPGYMKTMESMMHKISLADQKVLTDIMSAWFRELRN